MEQTDFLLFGKDENGRRQAAIAILGTRAFDLDIDYEIAECRNRRIKVVDCPGLGENCLDTEDEINELALWLTKAMEINSSEGFNAIVLVVKYGNQSMREELEGCEALMRVFGRDILLNHGIILMTGGDNFDRDSQRTGLSFHDWCYKQGGQLQELLELFGGRIVLFDNFTEDRGRVNAQLDILLDLTARLPGGGQIFTNDLLQRAGDERRQALSCSKKTVLSDTFMDDMTLIIQKFEELKDLEEAEGEDIGMDVWVDLSMRTESLVNHMLTESNKTDLEKYVLKFDKSLRELVEAEGASKKERHKAGKKLLEKTEKLDKAYLGEKSARIHHICDCIKWGEGTVAEWVAWLINGGGEGSGSDCSDDGGARAKSKKKKKKGKARRRQDTEEEESEEDEEEDEDD